MNSPTISFRRMLMAVNGIIAMNEKYDNRYDVSEKDNLLWETWLEIRDEQFANDSDYKYFSNTLTLQEIKTVCEWQIALGNN